MKVHPSEIKKQQELRESYQQLKKDFGIGQSLWDMTHTSFSPFAFEANKSSLIDEYITLAKFVEQAKKVNLCYYLGIDEFLEQYKTAVESCLKF